MKASVQTTQDGGTLTGKEALRYARKEFPCRKNAFIAKESGEIVFYRCGRRSCPLCAVGYAAQRGKAVETAHGLFATHFVFTLGDPALLLFPTHRDFLLSKNRQREESRIRMERRDLFPTDILKLAGKGHYRSSASDKDIAEVRKRIKAGSKLLSEGVRRLLVTLQSLPHLEGREFGRVRAIEFGELHDRWHAHVVIPIEWDVIRQAFSGFTWDQDRGVYFGRDPWIWRYGDIRIKVVDGPVGGIAYMTEYVNKSSPGRVTLDKGSVRMMSRFSSVVELEYVRAGAEHRALERARDEVYEDLRVEIKKNEDFRSKHRMGPGRRSQRQIQRRFGGVARRASGCNSSGSERTA